MGIEEERAKVDAKGITALPGVGNPIVPKPTQLDTGTQLGPSMGPFVAQPPGEAAPTPVGGMSAVATQQNVVEPQPLDASKITPPAAAAPSAGFRQDKNAMPKSPGPNVFYQRLEDANGFHGFRENINGSNSAPTPKTPFTDPSRFSKIIGFDRKENPIYSDGAAAMAAANQGIANYNTTQAAGFKDRNDQWAAANGLVPLQQANANLANTSAAEMPGENKSQQAYRLDQGFRDRQQGNLYVDQAGLARQALEQGKLMKYSYETPNAENPFAPPLKQEGFYNPVTEKDIRPGGMRSNPLASLMADLTPAQKKRAVEYGTANPKEDKASILRRVASGEIK